MRLKKKMLGIILSLVLVLGLMPGMGMTAHADNTETLLTTITPTSLTTYSETTSGVVTVSQNSSYYSNNDRTQHTWLWQQADTVEVSGCEGYTITKVIFKLKDKNPFTDSDKPFQLHFVEGDFGQIKCQENEDFDGVSLIEVYGYANQTTVAVTGVSLNKETSTLTVGDTETLTATVNPDDATDKSVTWSSSDTDVATVSDGVVTAVAEGTANITVTATNGTDDTSDDKTATCAVTVNAASSGGDSSDSGSGDSSGGSSDSGSGSSSGDSSDSGSGSSSGGSSDSGNTSEGTSSGSSDNTNTTTDTGAKVPYESVPISTGSVTDITGTAAATAESNPFGTKIENNSNLTTLLSLTDAEVAQGVNVWLDIQDMSSSVSKSDKSKIEKKSGDYTVGMYLDINLFKKVGNNDATKVSETNGKIKASIVIPKKLRKSGRTFEIIRVHNGKATTITGKYTKKTHVFTFETDKFSTYAIAYKDAASSTDSETTDSSSSATTTSTTTTTTTASTGSTSTTATAPKTGDASDMRFWCLLVIASFAGLGVYEVSRKKKASK